MGPGLNRLSTCVASVMVLIECLELDPNTTELPRDAAKLTVWSGVEVNIAVTAGMPLRVRNVTSS